VSIECQDRIVDGRVMRSEPRIMVFEPDSAGLTPAQARQLAYRGTRNLRAVQVLLGHASIATTERYVAVDDSEIRAAMVAAQ
jgi:integrase